MEIKDWLWCFRSGREGKAAQYRKILFFWITQIQVWYLRLKTGSENMNVEDGGGGYKSNGILGQILGHLPCVAAGDN